MNDHVKQSPLCLVLFNRAKIWLYVVWFLSAELERDAEEEQIKVAYRRLAKYYHPDGTSLHL